MDVVARNQPYQRTPILPTGFNRSTPSSPASAASRAVPASNVAFFDENRFCKESPFQPGYDARTVFFTDLASKHDVEDFFAFTGQESRPRRDSRRTTKYYNDAAPAQRYNPVNDDLTVWKKRPEMEPEGAVKDINAHGHDNGFKSADIFCE